MRTIEELVAIEQQYIEERISEIENINFGEVLQEENLTIEEFQYKKAELFLKTFNPMFIVGETVPGTETFDTDRARLSKNTFLCALPKQKVVFYPTGAEYNKEYCEQNNILCIPKPYLGGVICSLPVDLDVSIIALNAPSAFSQVILNKVVNWIKTKTSSEVIISGNDILIEGNKVLGMGNYSFNSTFVCGFHLSFDIDLDFIQQVCNKEIVKVPIGLNNFGAFNREELITEMMSWLK